MRTEPRPPGAAAHPPPGHAARAVADSGDHELHRRRRPVRRQDALPPQRAQRAAAARRLPWPVAELRRRDAAEHPAGDPAARLRPGRHPLRPREQLRAALRQSAEINFGRLFREDFRPYRDELVISTKAGYDMWPGPYGEWGSRKYLLASLDQSLKRMGRGVRGHLLLHRFDPDTPLEETMGALDTAVRSGKALYAGISSYSPERTREAAAILQLAGHAAADPPAVVLHAQPLDRGRAARRRSESRGVGCIAFSPLAQGLLTTKYLDGVPAGSRASRNGSLSQDQLTEQTLAHVRALNDIAAERGQTLAQMAISWVLRDPRMTSALVGAQQRAQLEENLAAAAKTSFTRRGDRRRSTRTRSRPASTSGPPPATADRRRWQTARRFLSASRRHAASGCRWARRRLRRRSRYMRTGAYYAGAHNGRLILLVARVTATPAPLGEAARWPGGS